MPSSLHQSTPMQLPHVQRRPARLRVRAACLLMGALFLFSLCSSVHAAAQAKGPRIYLQWQPQAQFAGFIMAKEKKLFQKHGLESVELIWANLGDAPLLALGQRETEYATGWLLTALQVRSKGYDLVNIAQLHQRSGTMLVARKDHGIRTLQDINNKILLSWGAEFGAELEYFLARNDIKPSRILPLSASLAPFLSGLVSVMQAMEFNEYYRILERGMQEEELVVFRFSALDFNFAGDGLYTTWERIKDHPREAAALRKAVLEGWEYALDHEEETIATVLRYAEEAHIRSNATHQRHMLHSIRELMQYTKKQKLGGALSPQDFESARQLLLPQHPVLNQLTFQDFHFTPQ